MAESSHSNVKVEAFEPRRHDRSGFDCGNALLTKWLQKRVRQFEKRDLARTYVLVEGENPRDLGYYAISSHSVVYEALAADQAKGLPRLDCPVVLLGCLAIDRSVQGQGFGEFLLIDALRRAEYLARQVGVRAVEVEAVDEAARRFYLKYNFIPLEDDPRHLFLPMNVIRKLKLPSIG